MPTVPINKLIPTASGPSPEHLLMAAAMMHQMGRFEKAPLADSLVDTQKQMERQQRLMDSMKIEDIPRTQTKERDL